MKKGGIARRRIKEGEMETADPLESTIQSITDNLSGGCSIYPERFAYVPYLLVYMENR